MKQSKYNAKGLRGGMAVLKPDSITWPVMPIIGFLLGMTENRATGGAMSVIPCSMPQLVINKHLLADIVRWIRIRDELETQIGRDDRREKGAESFRRLFLCLKEVSELDDFLRNSV